MSIPSRTALPTRAILALAVATLSMPSALALPGGSATCHAESGPTRATLVELFTSEGCSSCPPAEQWVSRILAAHPSGVIPLALHVTYWNDLGWRDRFGDSEFDRRQDWYTHFATNRFAYTPEMFRNGVEWQDWRSGDGAPRAAQPASVVLSLDLDARSAASGSLAVTARLAPLPGAPALPTATRELLVYAWQDGVQQQPDAGELRGVKLRHDHVVRAWTAVRAPEPGRDYALKLALPADAREGRIGLVALLQDRATGEVAQALELPVCAP